MEIFTTALRNIREKGFSLRSTPRNDNSIKWVLFNIVNGQIASDAPLK